MVAMLAATARRAFQRENRTARLGGRHSAAWRARHLWLEPRTHRSERHLVPAPTHVPF